MVFVQQNFIERPVPTALILIDIKDDAVVWRAPDFRALYPGRQRTKPARNLQAATRHEHSHKA